MNKPINILSIENLDVSIANKTIINDLNLKVNSQEIHAIMGPNGSGKSTFAKTLAGHPECLISKGKITYFGTNITNLFFC